MMPRQRLAVLAVPLVMLACGDSITDPGRSEPIDLALPWVVASPESQGIDPGGLSRAVGHAATLPRILSLLVVRHGRLVAEEYFNDNTAESLNDVRSITKSVVSTLIGIAIQRGEIESLDESVQYHLGPFYEDLPAELADVTLRDLLTMSGGFEWDESTTVGYNEWILSGDYVGYLLDRPIVNPPGTTFTYNSAAVHLLAVILQVATNEWIQDYADEHLFGPIGITGSSWEILLNGWANGGSGIDLRPRDLARLGTLWLQKGRSGATRILPESWVADGTQPAFAWWDGYGALRDQSYGYLWWLTRSTRAGPAHIAWGHGGQFVYVVPGKDVVVVVTHDWRGANSLSTQLATNGLDLIINHVLPAIR
jgi:CubicO group peptidase (beta-lactamase class C family)